MCHLYILRFSIKKMKCTSCKCCVDIQLLHFKMENRNQVQYFASFSPHGMNNVQNSSMQQHRGFFSHYTIVYYCKYKNVFHLCLQDIGAGKGKYYAVNFPMRDGIDDESYGQIFKPVSVFLNSLGLCFFRFVALFS